MDVSNDALAVHFKANYSKLNGGKSWGGNKNLLAPYRELNPGWKSEDMSRELMGKFCSISHFSADGIKHVACHSHKQLLQRFLRAAVPMCMYPLPFQTPQAQTAQQHRQDSTGAPCLRHKPTR